MCVHYIFFWAHTCVTHTHTHACPLPLPAAAVFAFRVLIAFLVPLPQNLPRFVIRTTIRIKTSFQNTGKLTRLYLHIHTYI